MTEIYLKINYVLNFARNELFHPFLTVVYNAQAMNVFNQKMSAYDDLAAEQIACNRCKPYASLDLVKIERNIFS
jgi:hypothetical protein